MTEELTFKTTQIGIFNPGRLSDEEIERAFITRIKVFEYLLEGIVTESPDAIPQHYLIIGQRGMGKSTLLHRIAVELRKENYCAAFLPLTFPEEQYNVDRLSKFWLNCLDALADALDREGSVSELAELDRDIRQWAADAKAISPMDMYGNFAQWAKRVGRRPVLLADNLGLIFDRLSKEEQHQLRAILMNNGAPILVGASSSTLADTVDYGAPFYDAFQIQYLKKLTFEETQDVLRNLAEITNNPSFLNEMMVNRARLRTLYQLTGGTPRTVVMLYPLIQSGFSAEVQNDLEGLMDVMTPLYKARFEELSEQMQVILDAVALHWDPIALDDLRQATQLENQQLSPQLKRLTEVGWLERLNAYQKKGNAYQISERFFNIWYLMRRSSRRQKKELLCLTKFLVSYYGEELSEIGQRLLFTKSLNRDHVSIQLAIAGGVKDRQLAEKLTSKSWEDLFEMLKNDSSILRDFEIPGNVITNKEKELVDKIRETASKGNWSETYDICKEILKVNPKMAFAQSLLGYIYERIYKNYKEAELAYLEATKMDKKNALPWNGLGDIYKDLGKNEKSKDAYLRAIKLNKKYFQPWNGLGELYHNIGEKEESEKAFLTAISLNDGYAYTWNGLGNLYQSTGKYKKAELAYLEAIKRDKNSLPARLNLILLYRDSTGQIEEAKKLFYEIGQNPEDEFYWFCLSIFAMYDKNFGLVEKYFVNAMDIIQKNLSTYTQSDIWRYASISLRLGYGDVLLTMMKRNGYDTVLRPYYIAIQSILSENSEDFLNSVAVEIREAAADAVERIKKIT